MALIGDVHEGTGVCRLSLVLVVPGAVIGTLAVGPEAVSVRSGLHERVGRVVDPQDSLTGRRLPRGDRRSERLTLIEDQFHGEQHLSSGWGETLRCR